MALVGQRYLMAIGGNDGKRPLADVWALDTTAKPYERRKLKPEGEGPPPCMYATVSACSDGLLLLCGGWDANSVNSQAQISSCMILKPWRHIIYYYHISKMWTKPLQEVYNAQEADDYFKCRLHMVRLRLIEVLGSFASTTIRIRI